MSLKSAPYYWVECDDCSLKASEGCDVVAWAQEWAAYDDAITAEFVEVERPGEDTLHYCLECAEKRGLIVEEE